jgi:uncharacterized membrane protein
MEKGKVHGVCPACGVPEKMFEPYVEKISASRKFILSLDAHPILVHFPISFTVTILCCSVAALLFTGRIHSNCTTVASMLGIVSPLVTALAFAAGYMDGKVRFRRVSTPLLKSKILWGAVLFALGCAQSAIALASRSEAATVWVLAGLSLVSMPCVQYLAIIGVGIKDSKFPG